jgi:hypothetical protein
MDTIEIVLITQDRDGFAIVSQDAGLLNGSAIAPIAESNWLRVRNQSTATISSCFSVMPIL